MDDRPSAAAGNDETGKADRPAENGHLDALSYLRLVYAPGDVIELRILECVLNPKYRPSTVAGYYEYDHLPDLVRDSRRYALVAMGHYTTINPVNPAPLARAANRPVEWAKHTTSDADVVRRVGLELDFDPVRPAGISATDEEHALALAKMGAAVADLIARGWPEPIKKDTGNGGTARYRIDLPADDGGLVERVLKAADALYSDDRVKVDVSLSNASRIIRLPDTLNRKGDSTPDRPHRKARVISAPDDYRPVPRELLEAFVASVPVPEPPRGLPRVSLDGKAEGSAQKRAWVGVSTADDFNARATWESVLEPHDWTADATLADGEVRWTRPGKGKGTSATTGHGGRDVLKVFSDNAAPFEANKAYSKFQAYALLNHGGDESAAATALYAAGYGTRQSGQNGHPREPSPEPGTASRAWPRLEVGRWVMAVDREPPNFGQVEEDGGPRARIHFESHDGHEAIKWLHKSNLRNMDGSDLEGEGPEDPGSWPPLRIGEPPGALPFPVDVFPPPLRRFCREVAAAALAPVDFVGAAMLAVAGAAVGQSVQINIKRGWAEAPQVWIILVARPGKAKSSVLRYVLRVLVRIDERLRQESAKAREEWVEAKRAFEEDPENNPPPGPEPPQRRAIVRDITRESLVIILKDNPRGVLDAPDEAAAWVASFTADFRGRDRNQPFRLATGGYGLGSGLSSLGPG